MRKLVVCTMISLDGRSDGPGGDVTALPFDGGFNAYNAERVGTADTLVVGRTTFLQMRGYWPTVLERDDAWDHEQEIARRTDVIEKLVVSDTLEPEPDAPWATTTTIVRRTDAHARLAELKDEDGGDLLTFGSRTLWNDLAAAGLVDELHLLVGPALLGGGTPVFQADEALPLRLLDSCVLPDSQLVLCRYAPTVR
jgi:dihydrofolate reductase